VRVHSELLYVIAWTHEIADDALFGRVVLGEPILVYRNADGTLTALEDLAGSQP
jgi:phenylpropionate dioxygenase-like ring-hydroxylating dioxygenase large terminal subunit